MLVAFAHVAVTQLAGLAQHFINYFVKAVHVTRECVSIFHMAEVERKRLEIIAQVYAAVFARQNVLQADNEIAVLALLLRGGVDWIIEAHRVQEMPHSRPPNAGEHAVPAGIIASSECSILWKCKRQPFFRGAHNVYIDIYIRYILYLSYIFILAILVIIASYSSASNMFGAVCSFAFANCTATSKSSAIANRKQVK